MPDASITLPDIVNTAQTPQTLTPLIVPFARRRLTLSFTFGPTPSSAPSSVRRPVEGSTLTLTNCPAAATQLSFCEHLVLA